jgi:DNA-binding NtrC family response regulator
MRRLLDNARQAARSNATILVAGESGTGKSILARQIHLWSPRRGQPFVTDVRIIASSNRDLPAEVKAHRFSEDLFYSLSIVSLSVPPLCERPTDILPLAAAMLSAAAVRNGRGNLRLSPEAAAAMTLYRWPGNVRELQNAMEAAAVLCQGETIALAALPEAITRNMSDVIMPPSTRSLEEMERQQILRVLAESATLEQAAATLGINVATLWRKRKRYNFDQTTGWKLKRTVP